MQLLAARAAATIDARAKVTGNYEKGIASSNWMRWVVSNGCTPVAHCQHIAIYQPREQARRNSTVPRTQRSA